MTRMQMYINLHGISVKILQCQARETNSNKQKRHVLKGCRVTHRIKKEVEEEELGWAGTVTCG